MRASDAERERIAEALREAVAEGRLDMEEFEERLDAAYRARTHADLEPLVRDLPGAGRESPVPGGRTTSPTGVDPLRSDRIGGTPTSTVAIGVMGGFQRTGRWTVPRRFTSLAVFGGGEIDLRDASFEEREVVIRCFAVMGGVQVTVGPDVEVHVSGVGIMGGFDHRSAGEGTPGGPRVVITGVALFGGVAVERKLPENERKGLKKERTWSWDERRSSRSERMSLRRQRRGSLGGGRRGELD